MSSGDEVVDSSARFFDYSLSIAREFEARLNRLRVFVPHNQSSGNANEAILRDFLSSHAPTSFEVGQGFICDPAAGKVSRQCDILLHDRARFPLVYSDGPIRVVWPMAARMIIEVKTNFEKGDIETALLNIQSALSFDVYWTKGFVFAFTSASLATVAEHLQNLGAELGLGQKEWPTAIFLLDQGVIFHRWGWALQADPPEGILSGRGAYAIRRATTEKGAVVVACLLLFFFETLEFGIPSDTINLLMKFLERHTEPVADSAR
jgi:hypothetical protein